DDPRQGPRAHRGGGQPGRRRARSGDEERSMKVFGITIGAGGASAPLALGAHPTVGLLPPEVRLGRRSRGARRGGVALAVLLIVGVTAGGVWAKLGSITAQATLAAEQARTQALIDRQ